MESNNNNMTVVRVSGLMVADGENEGLARSIRENLGLNVKVIVPTPPWKSAEHPELAIERAIQQTLSAANGSEHIVLVGCSYGALLALIVACRLRFDRILRVILIEGPLHPQIPVLPPKLVPVLGAVCNQHYEHRAFLANEAVDTLRQLGAARVVVVCNRQDAVISPDAQRLPCGLQDIDLRDENLAAVYNADPARGMQITLPPHLHGVRRGIKSILPQAYLDHLFWSDEKFRFITELVNIAIRRKVLDDCTDEDRVA